MSSDLSASPYERLNMGGADFQPLSPVHFLRRSAYIFRDKIAIAYGGRHYTYGEFGARCERLAAALIGAGITPGRPISAWSPDGSSPTRHSAFWLRRPSRRRCSFFNTS